MQEAPAYSHLILALVLHLDCLILRHGEAMWIGPLPSRRGDRGVVWCLGWIVYLEVIRHFDSDLDGVIAIVYPVASCRERRVIPRTRPDLQLAVTQHLLTIPPVL